ncbi:phasin family protein [Rubrivirga sp.]|uniref:phasin family protein n=1 Tax=Rubrivirga sp. TaxID=1885344 RepID=UPI003B518F6B
MATKTATKTQDLRKEIKKTADDAVTTAKTTVESVQRDLTDAAGDVQDAVQKVFLAGLGALALAEEEGSKAFKRLVKKGEKVELPGLGMDRVRSIRQQIDSETERATDAVKGRVEDAKYVAGETADKAETQLSETVSAVMKRLGVPTRDEISELTASVERLTTHIERLKEERTHSTELTMEAVGGGWYEVRLGDVVVEKVQGKEEAEKVLVRVQEQRA